MQKDTVLNTGWHRHFFWGWYVVAGAFFILGMTYGIRYSFGVFVRPMFTEYGWSMSAISIGSSINILVYATVSMYSGRLVDRFAPKWMMIIGMLITAVGFFCLSRVETTMGLYLSYGVLCGVGTACNGVVVCSSAVGKWFNRKKGIALGISTMGIGVGTMALSPLAGLIVEQWNWRAGFVFFALLSIVMGIVLPVIFMGKSTPESCGMMPDGASLEDNPPTEKVNHAEKKTSLKPVLSDHRFWLMALIYALAVMTVMMAFVHQVAYAVEQNISRIDAAAALGVVGLSSAVGKLFFGSLSDRMKHTNHTAALGFAFMAAGMFVLMKMSSIKMLYLYGILFGIGYGSVAPLMPTLVSEHFGRETLGSAYGVLTFFAAGIGGGIGPALGGMFYDWQGNYTMAWTINTIILVVITGLVFCLVPAQKTPLTGRHPG